MERFDVLLSKEINISREKAKELIISGRVNLDGTVLKKPSKLLNSLGKVYISELNTKYVSRGGYKLEQAIKNFKIDVKDKICLDIGASTGGFTDCLLKHNAKLVYGIDVGTNQLNKELLNNKRVISMENTNIRNLDIVSKLPKFDIVVVDVSFISISLVLPIIYKLLLQNGICISLIKPQFEVGKKFLNKKGVVNDKKAIDTCLKNIYIIASSLNFNVSIPIESSLLGKNGNKEYFYKLEKR
ncbi:MAG: TlyA family RNA methyltransferase [Defluviitaleaceae bacterium]|nr:TlyA family RNA methyltransferase [Defluviitaleaceae bacterium]